MFKWQNQNFSMTFHLSYIIYTWLHHLSGCDTTWNFPIYYIFSYLLQLLIHFDVFLALESLINRVFFVPISHVNLIWYRMRVWLSIDTEVTQKCLKCSPMNRFCSILMPSLRPNLSLSLPPLWRSCIKICCLLTNDLSRDTWSTCR